jgi:hypothetical protein
MKQALVSKWQGKLQKGVLFLQDSASHTTAIMEQKLADLRCEVLKHPVCSPDLAPSDYCWFPNLKKDLKGTKFSTTTDSMADADDWFATQPSAFYLDGLRKLEQ